MSGTAIPAPAWIAMSSCASGHWPATPAAGAAGLRSCSTAAAAWLRAWQNIPASEPTERPTRATTCPQPMPGIAERLVEALASMALAVAAGR